MADAHLVPPDFEFVGQDAGERGPNVLAHLGADDVDRHDTVAVHREPQCRLERQAGIAARNPARHGRVHRRLQLAGEAEGEAGAGHGDQETAARGRKAAVVRAHEPNHGGSPSPPS